MVMVEQKNPPNKYKPEEKKVEKAITGTAKVRKRSKGRKFLDLFINEDAGNVGEYLLLDIIVPAVKDTMVDLIGRSAEMMFYGRTKDRSKQNSTYVSYNSYSNKNRRSSVARSRSVYSFDDIIVEDRFEAERVLDLLNEMIDKYGEATVADFYELVGVSGNGYTDRSFGWKDLRQAYVTRVREGYLFNLPRCIELD